MEFDDDTVGFFKRYRAAIGLGSVAAVIAAATVILLLRDGDTKPTRKVQEVMQVKVLPLPPPPPPPPPQKMPEQKMVEQEPEMKPMEMPKELPKDVEPPGPLGLDAKGDGPGDAFGLVGNQGGSSLLGGGGGGGGGSRWAKYVGMVQSQIEKALRENEKTRNARLQIEVLVWPDAAGRVSRVQLLKTSGNAEIDAVLRDEVLTGIRFSEPPPKDMPVPIVTRITARRPG
jgi:outer membrane biosynthesis protein TonB